MNAERSLYRARLDLQQRNRSLTLAQGAAQREADTNAAQSLLTRLTASTPAAAHLKSLEMEVGALGAIEAQITKDVATLKRRKMLRELGRSVKGRMWLAAGWALSVYCVWRVFTVSLHLISGPRVTADRVLLSGLSQSRLWLFTETPSTALGRGFHGHGR